MFYDHKFRRKMKKLTIYIAKHRHSTLMSCPSLPCSNCTKKIKEIGIKKIVYVDKPLSDPTMKKLKKAFNKSSISVTPNGILDNLNLHYKIFLCPRCLH